MHDTLEDSVTAIETELGISMTIVDNDGVLHTPEGMSVFSHARQSHRKNAVCDIDFCEKCIAHCRYEMNEKCQGQRTPFREECWKGVVEIVVPMSSGGIHYGMLYAGSWRTKLTSPARLSSAFAAAYKALPEYSDDRAAALMSILAVYADGIITRLKEMNTLSFPDSRGNKVATYIRENASGTIRLSDIAALLSISSSRTSVLLKKIFGVSLPSLVTAERLKRAKALLASSDLTLEKIASATGFFDEYHLSRSFKHAVGITPRAYRLRHRKENC
ncbi:MAG: helix-turn-helix domain-containing protein [Spirochaetota bacterium]